jgi:hypothetical protein
MLTRTTGHFITLASLLLAVPACLDQSGADQTAGTLRGMIVDRDGAAVSGARVIVDDLDGQVGFTSADGAFALDGVSSGTHKLHAIDDLGGKGATVEFEMKDGELVLDPVEVKPCEESADAKSCGGFDGEPAHPANPQIVIDEVSLAQQYGQVYGESVDVGGASDDQTIFMKLSVPGDFSGGGSLSLELPGDAQVASVLSVTDENGTHIYTLASGQLAIEVALDGDGHTYRVTATNLLLVNETFTGEQPEFTVEIGSIVFEGESAPIVSDPNDPGSNPDDKPSDPGSEPSDPGSEPNDPGSEPTPPKG